MSEESYVLDHDVTISDGAGQVTFAAGSEVTRLDLGIYFVDHAPKTPGQPLLILDPEEEADLVEQINLRVAPR